MVSLFLLITKVVIIGMFDKVYSGSVLNTLPRDLYQSEQLGRKKFMKLKYFTSISNS